MSADNQNAEGKELCFKPQGNITLFESPAGNFIFNFLALVALGQGFDVINNYYFSAVMLFVAPLLFDLAKFYPAGRKSRILRRIYFGTLLIPTFMCIFGFMGAASISHHNGSSHIMFSESNVIGGGIAFPAAWLWGACVVGFGMTWVYYFATKSPAEEEMTQSREHRLVKEQRLKKG